MKFNFGAKLPVGRIKNKFLFIVMERPDVVVIAFLIIIFLYLGSVFLLTISPALNFEPTDIQSGSGINYSLYETARDNLARHETQAAEALEKTYPNPFNPSVKSE